MSNKENDLVERFVAAFNSVDKVLRARLGVERPMPFPALIREYSKKNRYWKREDDMRRFADLRNFVIHERVKAYQHLAVPSEQVVKQIEDINRELSQPETAFQRFQRPVETIQVDSSLAEVFKLIHQRDYSQFPLYSGDSFLGLLTENGIIRWLAQHVSNKLSLVDLEEVKADVVIREEEAKTNYAFVSRDTPVWEVRNLFAERVVLEAVLLTHSGKSTEALLGVATRWDMLQLSLE